MYDNSPRALGMVYLFIFLAGLLSSLHDREALFFFFFLLSNVLMVEIALQGVFLKLNFDVVKLMLHSYRDLHDDFGGWQSHIKLGKLEGGRLLQRNVRENDLVTHLVA